jgi:predicted transcriptional regulator
MLKRAYDVLAEAPRPLTTQEVADRIGRSRSTTSQYLNELHQRNLLLKTYGTTPDKSRNVVFRPANQNQDKI